MHALTEVNTPLHNSRLTTLSDLIGKLFGISEPKLNKRQYMKSVVQKPFTYTELREATF